MSLEQNTLIYIDEKDRHEARIMAKCFAEENIRNRAFTNVLGAILAGKYLTSEGIAVSPVDNLHNIRKILEKLDISDVILPRTHIDVRVVFDENYIFVPKSHFDLKILPHIYLVFELAHDVNYVKFLGFFEPAMINQNNFMNKKDLIPVARLTEYLEKAQTSTVTELSEAELDNFNESIIEMVDDDIDELDEKILIKVLTKSPELRNKFIEFENFELISYKAANEYQLKSQNEVIEVEQISSLEPIDEFENFDKNDEILENLSQTEDEI